MLRRVVQLFILLLVVFIHGWPCMAVEAPRNPSSAKECAICHYRWVDTFFIDRRGSELVPYQGEAVAASPEMCHSCHDGSAVDSRARVYNDKHHQTGRPPPQEMKIPDIFPLDKNGNMECATCHTAHGTTGEMSIDRAIFMRTSNKDSAMCMMCHVSKKGGQAKGNHPIDNTSPEIATELQALGSQVGSSQNKMICETCHTPHGSLYEGFLVQSAKDASLCILCHKEQAKVTNSPHDFRTNETQALNNKGKTALESGVCGACHLVHGGGSARLWARSQKAADQGGELLCLDCHSDTGPARKKQLTDHNHPVNVTLATADLTTTLPLYDNKGMVVQNGMIACQTCHDPHRWDPVDGLTPTGKTEGSSSNRFLRLENSTSPALCVDCHKKQGMLADTDHDLRAVAPESRNIVNQTPAQSGVCGVCHLAHGGGKELLWSRSPADSSFGQYLCETCHRIGGEAEKKVLHDPGHPMNISPAKKTLSTNLPLYNKEGRKDPNGIMTCLTCHNPHRWNPSSAATPGGNTEGSSQNSFLRLENSPVPKLCTDCHKEQGVVAGTDHDLQVTAGDSRNLMGQSPAESGACGVCHAVHNGENELFLWSQAFGKGNGVLNKMCNNCHSPEGSGGKKIPRIASHPTENLVTNVFRNRKGRVDYFPIFDNVTGEPVQVGDIACASCHNVHQWNPAVQAIGPGVNLEGTATDSFLRHRASNMACTDCHGFDALYRFKYYHDPKKRKPIQGGR